MTGEKQLWLLAGGNGAGKSTFYEQFLEPRGIRIVNADRIAHAINEKSPERASYDAAQLAERIRYHLLQQGISFCFETVFSHHSKIDFMADAKAHGYEIILVFLHLDNPALNLARVSQRVSQGGHDVPEDKVRSRLPRTFEYVKQAMPLADEVHLLDNSSHEHPLQRIATVRKGQAQVHTTTPPIWALEMLRGYLSSLEAG